MGKYTPGYVDVPGKGRRYRDADGNYFHNHLGKPLTQIGNLFGNPGFGRTTQHHVIGEDGSIGGRVKPKAQTPAAPAEPAVKPEPPTSPTPPTPPAPTPPTPVEPSSGGSGGPEVRESPQGIVQKGMTLGGINTFLTGLGGRELADIKAMYATDTGSAPSVPSNMRGTKPEQPFFEGLPGMAAPTAPTGTTASTTETTSNPTNEQDGASDKPTLADNVRAVRMSRPRGARQQEFADRPGNSTFGGEEPDDSSLVSPMYRNSKRNEIRSAFLNMDRSSAQAAMDSAAVAGRYRDVIGSTDYYNYGGKAVQAKEGMERQAKNAAMMGQDPTEFLNIQAEQTPSAADSPTSLQLNPDQGQKAAQEFKDFRAEEIKKGLK